MTRAHFVAGICFLALAAFVGSEAARLDYYSPLGPGAGFFPVWLSVALGALSLTVIAAAFRSRASRPPQPFWPGRRATLQILAVLLGLAFVVVALKPLGFRITMAVFAVGVMPALGSRSPVQIAGVALLASIVSYALFVDGLGLSLPVGVLGF